MNKRTAFFISDGTGITAEALGKSLLAQFERIQFEFVTKPYIDTVQKAQALLLVINETAQRDGSRPLIIDTVVDQKIRDVLHSSEAFKIDVFSTFLSPLEQELSSQSSYTVGRTHAIPKDASYKSRIDSVHFALDNDDGARTHQYDKADVILVGVSRCGKTPTCLYMALQFGIRAANYPFTEEDMFDFNLPKALKPYKHKLFGLTIDPQRLAAIRHERRPGTRYSSLTQCEREVHEVEELYRRHAISFVDSTHYSIEEISTRILAECGIERRFSPK
ncbi:hypothetical protein SAMN05421831_101184 [Allopseudospirillum japonicum]|uniref:Putative phosphoenolpyruvate synthase regulatory protein n=1 Tax=Allopseudospirillum japonicum TaxID=64971 RepID=A0A1H6QH75_9GAMM|nr:pyruvate, water dikinase regulatory protein [Allopseudospirillum japonicum]SEI38770.1 hypothetical protein SAMN05421831_101184 [Allopseudospirillum japonicum]